MKMGFLFFKEVSGNFQKGATVDLSGFPEYFAWKFGPFSRDLLIDLEFLINRQYILSEYSTRQPIPEEIAEYRFWIEDLDDYEEKVYDEEVFSLSSDLGVPKAKELWEGISESQQSTLIQFKTKLNNAPLSRILEYVYKTYQKEGYTDRSEIRDRYLH
jgi:hypothetical protein